MTTAKQAHTAGKWYIGKSYTDDVAIREPDDDECIIVVLPVPSYPDEQKANAELAAKAYLLPECENLISLLIEELKDGSDIWEKTELMNHEENPIFDYDDKPLIEILRTLLAKLKEHSK